MVNSYYFSSTKVFYMRRFYLLFGLFFLTTLGYSQDDESSFVSALRIHLKNYNKQTNKIYEQNELEKGQVLFDSLVQNYLVGTTFQDYTLKSFEKRKLKLSSFNKPLFILTFASWCIPTKGQIPALNKLAQKYSKDVKFVILFWDKKHQVKQLANKFNHNITICYAHETYKNDANVVAHLKHSLGFPTSYFLDQNLKVINIKRVTPQPEWSKNYVKAYTMNYNVFREGLGCLLIDKNIKNEQLSTN